MNTIRRETKIKIENKFRDIRMRRKQEERFKLPPGLERSFLSKLKNYFNQDKSWGQ